GVDRIVLDSAVKMHLYPEETDSGFLVSGTPNRKPAPPQARPKKDEPRRRSHLVIKTPGPFDYDLVKDLARFDALPAESGRETRVEVIRVELHEKESDRDGVKLDQLLCHHLELQFRKRSSGNQPGRRDDHNADREIESALATARPGSK